MLGIGTFCVALLPCKKSLLLGDVGDFLKWCHSPPSPIYKKTSKKKPVTYSFMGFPIRHYNGTFYFREDDAKKYFGMMCLNYLVKDDDGDKYFLKEEYIKEIKLNGRDYQK